MDNLSSIFFIYFFSRDILDGVTHERRGVPGNEWRTRPRARARDRSRVLSAVERIGKLPFQVVDV